MPGVIPGEIPGGSFTLVFTPQFGRVTEDELAGLKMAMNKLMESQKRGQAGGNGRYQDGKAQDLIVITYFQYHKKVNFQDNCPLAKKSGASSGNEQNTGTGYETSTAWRYKRPENGELDTKVVNDTAYKFCNKCGRWKSGGIRHSSKDHKKTEEIRNIKSNTSNVRPLMMRTSMVGED